MYLGYHLIFLYTRGILRSTRDVIVIIKYPDSDNALRRLWDIIMFVRDRFNNCINQHHTSVAILYISSLIISPRVAYRGNQLLNEIRKLVNFSPKNFICLVRTTAPSRFPRLMRFLQEQAIDFLRDRCYTVVYCPRREFLNHAKFLMSYHVCFSEGRIYHGKYYGSTNLTVTGLAYREYGRGSRRIGNYEEFCATNLRSMLSLRRSAFYLEEILDLINHKVSLYTNSDYLREYLTEHLMYMESILRHSRRIVAGTTLGELYETYVDLLVAHSQTYALLDEIPGKKLTKELEKELAEIKPPANPFELEMMMPTNTKQAELLAKDLGLQRIELRKMIRDYIDVVEKARELIEVYLTMLTLREIKSYLDSKEYDFMEFIELNNEYHRKSLKKIMEIVKKSGKL